MQVTFHYMYYIISIIIISILELSSENTRYDVFHSSIHQLTQSLLCFDYYDDDKLSFNNTRRPCSTNKKLIENVMITLNICNVRIKNMKNLKIKILE